MRKQVSTSSSTCSALQVKALSLTLTALNAYNALLMQALQVDGQVVIVKNPHTLFFRLRSGHPLLALLAVTTSMDTLNTAQSGHSSMQPTLSDDTIMIQTLIKMSASNSHLNTTA
jgi:hypothetical protein